MLIAIKNQAITLTVDTMGAQMMSLCSADGCQYLWQGDPKYWEDRAPVLFPFIARLYRETYRLNGQEHRMKIHGFAASSEFSVAEQGLDFVTMRLESTADTYAVYPVEFALEVQDMPVELSESGKTVVDTGNGYDVILEKDEDDWYAWTSSGEEDSEEQPPYIDRLILVDPYGSREYVQNGDLSGGELLWTAIVTDDGQKTTLSLVSSSLADSLLGRLYFLNGVGLTRYKVEPEFSNDTSVYRVIPAGQISA